MTEAAAVPRKTAGPGGSAAPGAVRATPSPADATAGSGSAAWSGAVRWQHRHRWLVRVTDALVVTGTMAAAYAAHAVRTGDPLDPVAVAALAGVTVA
jgi:hypothetical protein